jgi:DNA-binding CsgD family transcriptional regulator
MATLAPIVSHARDELIGRAGRAPSVGALFGETSARLRRLVPYDSAVWLAFDPATGLPTAPTRAENLSHACSGGEDCMRVWELEFLVQDVNRYRDLARAESPAAGLRLATDDRPARSARYRRFIAPNGFDDELRAVMRVDGAPWASVALFRDQGRPAFDTAETELVASVSAPLAAAVRDHARREARLGAGAGDRGPGLLLFAPGGELISANDDALAWLEELPADAGVTEAFSVPLPMVVAGTLMRARAIAEARDHGIARARVRSRTTGRWLVCHASRLRDGDGAPGCTALVIEPAQASEIAPIITQAYELSRREQEITQLIARGLSTADMAARLHLSAHTVRDYVKAIFEKVQVSSRGELVAKLFAEHYASAHLAPDSFTRADD